MTKYVKEWYNVNSKNGVCIYQKNMAGYLILRNCKLLYTFRDPENNKRVRFVFAKDDNLVKSMDDYAIHKEMISGIAHKK